MPGIPGAGGPVPKRSDQRRRTNSPGAEQALGAAEVPVPEANADWHPVAAAWFASLSTSGQAAFYEPSDWATAVLIAESMSRDLNPQVVGVTDDGATVMEQIPLKGASLAAYLKAFAVLLVTEGDRRRSRLELQRPQAAEPEAPAEVSELDAYRSRLTS